MAQQRSLSIDSEGFNGNVPSQLMWQMSVRGCFEHYSTWCFRVDAKTVTGEEVSKSLEECLVLAVMLVTPRLYQQFTTAEKEAVIVAGVLVIHIQSWMIPHLEELRHAQEMLLVHQVGSVRVGEVVRLVAFDDTGIVKLD